MDQVATALGNEFLNGDVAIPKYVFVYNSKVYGFSKQTVTVDECRVKFKLNELFDPIHVKEADIAA